MSQRIAPLQPSYSAQTREQLDRITSADMPPLAVFRTLATNERAWRTLRATSLPQGELLSIRERELVILRACARTRCEYQWGVHARVFAASAKFDRADLAATVAPGVDPDRWTEREAALIAAVDGMDVSGSLAPAQHLALAAHFDADQIAEILLLAKFYRTVADLANGLDLPLQQGSLRFADVRDGHS